MHRTTGDSFGTDAVGNIFRQEDGGGTFDATQLDFTWANAVQEEIATVIESESITLNSDSEPIASMNQMNTAIDQKISTETTNGKAAYTGISNGVDQITNGAVSNALQYMIGGIDIIGLRLEKKSATELYIHPGRCTVYKTDDNLSLSASDFILFQNTDTTYTRTLTQLLTESGLTPGSNLWYHIFACVSSGAVSFGLADIQADTSVTGSNIVTVGGTYDNVRRIGSIKTDGSGNITGFKQRGDTFLWDAPSQTSSALSSGAQAIVLDVPLDVSTTALFSLSANSASFSVTVELWDGILGSSITGDPILLIMTDSSSFYNMYTELITTTSRQIYVNPSSALTAAAFKVRGYNDPRGRLDWDTTLFV